MGGKGAQSRSTKIQINFSAGVKPRRRTVHDTELLKSHIIIQSVHCCTNVPPPSALHAWTRRSSMCAGNLSGESKGTLRSRTKGGESPNLHQSRLSPPSSATGPSRPIPTLNQKCQVTPGAHVFGRQLNPQDPGLVKYYGFVMVAGGSVPSDDRCQTARCHQGS
jgi:hypothetical protein